MIVLDTNVVSEAMKPEPNAAVRAWLNEQAAETLYLSSVTLAELLFGIRALPVGRRKNMLGQTLDGLLEMFEGRVLPFLGRGFNTHRAKKALVSALYRQAKCKSCASQGGILKYNLPPMHLSDDAHQGQTKPVSRHVGVRATEKTLKDELLFPFWNAWTRIFHRDADAGLVVMSAQTHCAWLVRILGSIFQQIEDGLPKQIPVGQNRDRLGNALFETQFFFFKKWREQGNHVFQK